MADGTSLMERIRAEQEIAANPDPAMREAVRRELAPIAQAMEEIQSILLAQQRALETLQRAMATVRVSRTQELALQEAVRNRARELARAQGLPPGGERRIAAAIRTTLREVTGARAAGDVQAAQFDRALALIEHWYMEGALRRIRRTSTEAAYGGEDGHHQGDQP